ncbi:MAG TPA: tRNA dihydrouridine(20/20a) synthase DusA, partial [Caldimonas sp.]|nr:tRNA dihydrouridine(20/20a) synthase DusA [Caldimonas sp.]
ERVQRGAFGACLMAEPALVAECVKAMRDAVSIPVTVKHRVGIDRTEEYGFVRDFVGGVSEEGGCTTFIVHARNAWLHGLSPKQNREIPPLRPELVLRLAQDFPDIAFVINGGIAGDAAIEGHLHRLDGVMVGRAAYHEPFGMANWDQRFFAAPDDPVDRDAVEAAFVEYMSAMAASGEPWSHASRHMLGLRNATPGARRWRQVWSDHRLHGLPPREVSRRARAALAAPEVSIEPALA